MTVILMLLIGCWDGLPLPTDLDRDGVTIAEGDCDDTNALVYPGADELPGWEEGTQQIGDGVDNDCDGEIDNGTESYDDDLDGACETAPCVGGLPGGDCDDSDITVYAGASELEDGLDNDCDTLVDEGTRLWDDDGDGFAEIDGDCDDANPNIHPAAEESCDGFDNDCNDEIDEDFDRDGDGVLTADVEDCGADLDDEDETIYPGAPELCDGKDNDQDTLLDEDYDLDGDGAVDRSHAACTGFLVSNNLVGDCDDADAGISPDAPELCDGIDNDCNDWIDEAEQDPSIRDQMDTDGDGAICGEDPGVCEGDDERNIYVTDLIDGIDNDCDGNIPENSVDADGDGWAAWLECDDNDANTYPGATELCDGEDNDCDGIVDDETDASCGAY